MRQTPLGLILAGILAVSAFPALTAAAPAAEADASRPSPELVRLDGELAQVQDAKEHGRVAPERYADFRVRFRAELDAARAGAPPTSANVELYSRLLARLGESAAAAESLNQALENDPKRPSLHAALSQVRFDEKNYPAALAEADAALALDPADREALTLKRFSEGRVAMNGGGSAARAASSPPSARRSFARRFHFAAPDPATLPYKLPVKISPAPEPPALLASAAPAAPGPLPLLPLALTVGLGAAAFEVSRSRGAYASADGLDDEHPKPVGKYQRLVAGTILAGAAGALIYLSGSALVTAAPAVLAYATNAGTQGLRLAGSEAGAINPGSIGNAEEAVPQGEAAEQIVIKKGEILNRVWHSEWTPTSGHSGPEGFSYCRGACLPIHAGQAIEARGLSVGVINNARLGGLYRATEDIIATVRQSVGGYEEEILLRSPEDVDKLQPIQESVSSIPHRP